MQATMRDGTDRKHLSYFQFVWTTFLLTSAGPFGFEYTVLGVGVGNALILVTLFALFYALPIALVSAELSGLMPSRHGQIAWGYRAFSKMSTSIGDYIGFLNACNIVIFWTLCAATTPIIIVRYLITIIGSLSSSTIYIIQLSVIISGLILNLFKFNIIATITSVLCIAIIIPFIIAFFWSIPEMDPSLQWTSCSNSWALALTTCLWEFSGFESLANIVNEVDFNTRRLISAFGVAIVLDATLLILPIITTAALHTASCYEWYDGFFAASFKHLTVSMEYAVAIGSVLMNWCMYVSSIGIIARMIWAMAQPYFQITSTGEMITPSHSRMDILDTTNTKISLNILPHRFFGEIWHKTGSPIYAVMLLSVIIAITNLYMDFDDLVEFNIFTYFIPFIIELSAYLTLKYTEPNAPRTFEIPFGKNGAWLTVSVVFLAIVGCFAVMIVENTEFFGIAVVLNIVLSLYYFIGKKWCHRMHQPDILENADKHAETDNNGYNSPTKLINNEIYSETSEEDETQPLL